PSRPRSARSEASRCTGYSRSPARRSSVAQELALAGVELRRRLALGPALVDRVVAGRAAVGARPPGRPAAITAGRWPDLRFVGDAGQPACVGTDPGDRGSGGVDPGQDPRRGGDRRSRTPRHALLLGPGLIA